MSSETASTGIKSFLNMATSVTANKDNLTSWATMLGVSVDELKSKLAGDLNGTLAETAQKIAAIQDPTERFQAAVKLAGTEGAPAILKLAAAGDTLQSALQKANSEWENGSSMMKTFEQNSSTLNAEWDTFTNTITRAGVELGNVLLPYVTDAVSLLNDGALAAINFGEAIYDLFASDSSSSIWGTNKQQQIIDEYEAKKAGETAAENIAEGITESDDLKAAPGEAMGSPEALAGAGEAGKELAKTVSKEFKYGVEQGMSDLDILALINAQTRINGDDRNEAGIRSTTLENGLKVDLKYQTDDGQTRATLLVNGQEVAGPVYGWGIEKTLPELFQQAGLGYNQGNVLDLTGKLGDSAIWAASQTTDLVLDSFLDVTSSTKGEIKAAGEEIAEAFAAGMTPDKAQVEAAISSLQHLQLYDPEEAKAQGSQNAIAYLTAIKEAIESYDEAKAKYLVEPDNERARADLERARANLQAQLDANPLKATVTTTWGQFDTKSFAELIMDPEAVKNAALDINKFFDGTIVPGIRGGMENARSAFEQGQITQGMVYDNLIKPLEQYADYLPGWLEEMNSMFKSGQIGIDDYIWLLDQMTGKASDALDKTSEKLKSQTVGWDALKDTIGECSDCAISDFAQWQESQDGLFQDSYIGQGGEQYLAWKQAQIEAIAETQAAMRAVGGTVLG
ncbi:MAG TPA: phage tail tape measure protein, partial [Methanothrix sp.]|nr:phage tail tape measure protein [Methanothrix sp.]